MVRRPRAAAAPLIAALALVTGAAFSLAPVGAPLAATRAWRAGGLFAPPNAEASAAPGASGVLLGAAAATLAGFACRAVAQRRSPRPVASSRGAVACRAYWEGEWICADCGYVYNARAYGSQKFEDLQKGYKCPSCGAPRRRFARKLGDTIGTSLDGGDGPIIFGTVAFLGFALAVFYWTIFVK